MFTFDVSQEDGMDELEAVSVTLQSESRPPLSSPTKMRSKNAGPYSGPPTKPNDCFLWSWYDFETSEEVGSLEIVC